MRSDRWSTYEEITQVLSPCTDSYPMYPLHGANTGEAAANADTCTVKGGPILYCRNGQRLHYDGEGHLLILGVSSSGKSRRCTIPMVRSFIEAEESFVVVDPKGEIYRKTGCYIGDSYQKHVIDFRRIQTSERWNPLALAMDLLHRGYKQESLECVDDLAYALYPINDKADPFWAESARSLFVAAAYTLLELAKPSEINIANIYALIVKGEERFGTSTYLKTLVDMLPDTSPAAMLFRSYVTTANDTRAGIRSTFMEGISKFVRSEALISMLSSDDLHISQLDGETPTAIWIILPDESEVFHSLAGNLVSQIVSHYIRIAQDRYHGSLKRRVNICLEEFGNIGRAIPALKEYASAGRSRGLRLQIVLQSLSQLTDVFGQSNATTILSNTDVWLAFRTNHWDTLTELSRKCGEREVEIDKHISKEPLITQSQLAAMETGQALVMISGRTKFITWLPDYSEMYDCSQWKEPIPREVRPLVNPKLFDIQAYVRLKKQQEMAQAIPHQRMPHPAFREPPMMERPFGTLSDDEVQAMMQTLDRRLKELDDEDESESCQNGTAGDSNNDS